MTASKLRAEANSYSDGMRYTSHITMNKKAGVDDPTQGQFHGQLAVRREVGRAMVVRTSPASAAADEKGFHYHVQSFFWVLLDGEATETLSNGKERQYRPFVPTFTPAGEMHAHRKGGKPPVGLGIVFLPSMESFLSEVGWKNRRPHTLEDPAACSAVRRLCGELSVDDPMTGLVAEGILYEILASDIRSGTGRKDVSAPPWLRRARDLLHDRFRDPLRLSDIAAEVGIHPVQLSSEFKRYFNGTPGSYLRELRLRAAARALASTDLAVSLIAADFGFFDEAHLAKSFKRTFGLTPSQYRASQKG
jgi:AraC family transcriptional regulator